MAFQDESTGPVERPNVKESEDELNPDLHRTACCLLQVSVFFTNNIKKPLDLTLILTWK